ncbi:MurR/RpiR family transcriptional regulator [[Mycoplasma] collis]|uniref:hypothetical protein n=1 Tax=[Mycoplasma] collis TaxID=2127 RepID=UPI00051B4951|nr:hypothetical protein [[Mycoplasma] collis]
MKIKHLNLYAKLTHSEQILEEWIEENPELFVKLTAKEILNHSILASSSIVSKYAKKIGYANLKELKNYVLNQIKNEPKKINDAFFNPTFYLHSRYNLIIDEIFKNISNNFLEKSYKFLKMTSKIYIYKAKNFNFSFKDFETYFEKRNKKIVYFDSYDFLLNNYEYNDELLLFIDIDPENSHNEFLNSLEHLKIKSIILSKNGFQTNTNSEIINFFNINENNFKDIDFFQNNFKITCIFILDLLITIFEK